MKKLFYPWKLNVRWRVLLSTLFYWGEKFSYSDIIKNIIESDSVRTSEFHNSRVLNDRFEVLSFSIEETAHLEGIIAEFGVYQGDTLRHISKHAELTREIHGFDSFEGFIENWGELLPMGHFKGPVPVFEEDNIFLEIGWFHETLPRFLKSKDKLFAIVHIDSGLYESAKIVLDHILPYLQKGTIIVFDEYYGYPSWQDHEYRAWKEFLQETEISCEPVAHSSHSASFRITGTVSLA